MMATANGTDWWVPIWIGVLLSVPVRNLWRRRGAGAVLLDIGLSKDRYNLLLCVVLAAGGLFWIFREGWSVLRASMTLLGIGIGFIAWSTDRFQLRQAGFWNSGRLIPWDRIEAYEISEAGSLSVKTPGKDLKFCCDIPPALRSKTEQLLASKCPSLQPKV
jgi:uncharacterized membrane protein YobD (UPF0266 family)